MHGAWGFIDSPSEIPDRNTRLSSIPCVAHLFATTQTFFVGRIGQIRPIVFCCRQRVSSRTDHARPNPFQLVLQMPDRTHVRPAASGRTKDEAMNATAVERITPPQTEPTGVVHQVLRSSMRSLVKRGRLTVVGIGVIASFWALSKSGFGSGGPRSDALRLKTSRTRIAYTFSTSPSRATIW
jgi:hypothetical protein